MASVLFNNSSIDEDTEYYEMSFEDENGRKIKLRPGESKAKALERVKKQKEIHRIKKLMRFAYPRQLESHDLKK